MVAVETIRLVLSSIFLTDLMEHKSGKDSEPCLRVSPQTRCLRMTLSRMAQIFMSKCLET